MGSRILVNALVLALAWTQSCLAQFASTVNQSRIWKTIDIGTYQSVIALREALQSAKCVPANARNSTDYRTLTSIPCKLGQSANEIIGQPEFALGSPASQLQLVLVSGLDLGFPPDDDPSLSEIYERAESLGYELCPPEVGPQLRLQYADQKIGEFFRIGMRPVQDYAGDLTVFVVGNGGAGMLLVGTSGRPDVRISATVYFVFAIRVPHTHTVERGRAG